MLMTLAEPRDAIQSAKAANAVVEYSVLRTAMSLCPDMSRQNCHNRRTKSRQTHAPSNDHK